VAYGIHKQLSPRFMLLMHLALSLKVVAIKPCIRIDRMSNKRKDEFVNGKFCT
jgi:hypothetical protein